MIYSFLKRGLDVTASLLLLVVCLPLFLIIIILLSITGERKVFYLQERIGYKNKRFKIWKFATMLKNSPNMGTGSLTLRKDPRVTVVGRFLRKTKLNELPQIINVLLGDMSLVGPRPQMEIDFLAYTPEVQKVIYNVKPGITGIGSIIFRDEEKLISEYKGSPREYYEQYLAPYKGELEKWYQTNNSLKTDILILFLTVWQIVIPSSKLVVKVFPNIPAAPQTCVLTV